MTTDWPTWLGAMAHHMDKITKLIDTMTDEDIPAQELVNNIYDVIRYGNLALEGLEEEYGTN